MAGETSFTRRFVPMLVLTAGAAFLLRAGYLWVFRNHTVLSDGWYNHQGALLWADGQGWVNPVGLLNGKPLTPDAHNPPLWRLVLGIASFAGLRAQPMHQLVGALIGTGTVVVVGLAGRRVAGKRVGLIAAGMAAVYPGFWTFEREMLSEVLLLFWISVALLLTYRFIDDPNTGLAVALGATVGLLTLTRSEQAMLALILLGPVFLTARTVAVRQRITWWALAVIMAGLVVAPWSLYNHDRFAEPVLLSTGLGYSMAVSNCDETYSGAWIGYFDFMCGYRSPGLWANDPAAGDLKMRSSAWDYAQSHADRLPVVLVAHEARTWSLFGQGQEVTKYREWIGTSSFVLWAWVVGFWVLVPLGIVGVLEMRRRRRPLYPMVAFAITVLVVTALTFGQPRYRSAADVPLVLLAAVGTDWLLRWYADRRRRSRYLAAGRPTVAAPTDLSNLA